MHAIGGNYSSMLKGWAHGIGISGGGTGGHIYPALNLIREIQNEDPQAEFLDVGKEKGLESKLAAREIFHSLLYI